MEEKTQDYKPKTSKLAVWSPVLGVIGFMAVFILALFVGGAVTLLGPVIGVVGIVLAIKALVEIRQSAGLLKGRILAICGILACIVGQVLGIYFAGAIFFYGHEILWRDMCGENLKELGIVMQNYANEHDGQYPIADEWCDQLVRYADVDKWRFKCPVKRNERCSYAINPNCQAHSPKDVVFLFESKGGWNQFGGLEILTTENHKEKGCNILFNDGSVKFVKTERLVELRWE